MPGPLKNARHERFCHLLLKGMTQMDAYVGAGYKRNQGNPGGLLLRPAIAARLAELQGKVAEKVVFDAAAMARQLDADRDFARENGQPAAAVSASMGKAKVLGLITDRSESKSTVTVEHVSPDEQRAWLSGLMAAAFEAKPGRTVQ